MFVAAALLAAGSANAQGTITVDNGIITAHPMPDTTGITVGAATNCVTIPSGGALSGTAQPCVFKEGVPYCVDGGVWKECGTWHLLTQTYGGTVSLLKNLTKHECEFAMHRVLGEPATDEQIAKANKAAEQSDAAWKTEHPQCFLPNVTFADCWPGTPSSMSITTVTAGTIRSAECFE